LPPTPAKSTSAEPTSAEATSVESTSVEPGSTEPGSIEPGSTEKRRCGILLHPAGHTLSPALHARAYADLGLNAEYTVYDVPPERLETELARLRRDGLCQLSVSLPHKEAVMALADAVSPAARAIGAANTLTWHAGVLTADNTDWIGVLHSLAPHGELRGLRATVLGAGGAARACVYALLQQGAHVRVVNRTPARAERLCSELGGTLGRLEDAYDLLINTTSVGMHPEVSGTPIPAALLRPDSLVFDIVYAPRETRLLREARASGCRTQEGLDMLLHQAVEQVRLWSGRTPEVEHLREAALEALAARARSG